MYVSSRNGGGKPKPALPEDVAKLEARAKSNPSLRPPSKPPTKAVSPAGIPTVKMLRTPVGEFDFSIYYDRQEVDLFPDELFYDCQEPPELWTSLENVHGRNGDYYYPTFSFE